ncbi:MAG TPA: YchJ family protein [Rectinemataceae bacterium]|nr:YchJ family protein [Rectinemataceae bacterium]
MDICPCGSGRGFEDCCGPLLAGTRSAAGAEELMRSRYTAYVRGAVDYVVSTCVPEGRESIDVEATRRWSEQSTWLGLRILKVDRGAAGDADGKVEFIATYVLDGLREEHHELSQFVRRDGLWLYSEGEVITETVVREGPKIGRNDPCPCGSGKKYKKCHGASRASDS